MSKIKLAIFDMAGTTVQDEREVEKCFYDAIIATNLSISSEKINSMMGWSKILVFETIWKEEIGTEHSSYQQKVQESYQYFCKVLEDHYLSYGAKSYDGVLDVFEFCRTNDIKVALTTGFYRKVTDIILGKLGWNNGLAKDYTNLEKTGSHIINCSVTSSDVINGRPAPEMIYLAMQKCGISDTKEVINLGDTPSDLQSASSADVLFNVGSLYGSHNKEELSVLPHDRLITAPNEIIEIIQHINS
ncbi:HAD hydrolase-like protein [Sphingobacterium sp. ML3W]|uniref:HAD family hydrolase n=1 Tax=Sphingobacterium sp. ML3W TaxID=1538644 RepID=UPI00249A009C|nr:HAD family hydrolase [Sphingobacterium sp. ML3W]WFA82101.1 HAD hydrolase-like protein [Sphingobacterium sp. ML3W]